VNLRRWREGLLALIPAFSPEEKETETPMVWRIEDGFSRADE